MNDAAWAVEAHDLWKVYEDGKQRRLEVLKGISLQVKRSESLAIVGPSGAGKTTLLNLLAGVDEPSGGEVRIGGCLLNHAREREQAILRNQTIGMVFQFYHLLSDLTALENVMLPGRIYRGRQGHKLRERAMGLLADVGLESRVSHFPSQLSGGEMQRVAIARALMNDPEIILCDEPTGNLDSETGHEISQYLKKLYEIDKKTLIIVTHDDNIAGIASRLLRLEDGAWKTG